ncbi:hypothetical protein [Streptomyces eurythermus]|uniref:hypothetical protein n=1 Tax=Streptomyces eurythermus TaxID=42237 RepID=UPI0036D36C4C
MNQLSNEMQGIVGALPPAVQAIVAAADEHPEYERTIQYTQFVYEDVTIAQFGSVPAPLVGQTVRLHGVNTPLSVVGVETEYTVSPEDDATLVYTRVHVTLAD